MHLRDAILALAIIVLEIAAFYPKAAVAGSDLQRTRQLEEYLKSNPGQFNWQAHNELRHLYITAKPPNMRKAMEHVNEILRYSLMDEYVIQTLSDWEIDKNSEAARFNLDSKARLFPELQYLRAAVRLKIGDLYASERNIGLARAAYIEVYRDEKLSGTLYRKMAEDRLRRLHDGASRLSACIFYAPNGIGPWSSGIAEIIGHVGWAFKDPEENVWIFGSTENIKGGMSVEGGDPKKTQSWMRSGEWDEVIAVFASGGGSGRGKGYYESYRCIEIDRAYPGNARIVAHERLASGYSWNIDNCLTKTIEILKAYGVRELPAGYVETSILSPHRADPVLPSIYYERVLSSVGFGDMRYLVH